MNITQHIKDIANALILKAELNSPAFTGTPTAPDFSYKPTPVTITSWSYITTTITLNVASHTFVAGDYIKVMGLTATTNIPNGVHLVTSVTATAIVFTYALTPTGTAGVSSATVKGYMTTNGRVETIGVGQTWQNVSRTWNTSYTNSTGKPIFVSCGFASSSTATSIDITVSGLKVASVPTSSFTFPVRVGSIVPNDATYSFTLQAGSPTGAVFYELR